jgi:hypothetical protein
MLFVRYGSKSIKNFIYGYMIISYKAIKLAVVLFRRPASQWNCDHLGSCTIACKLAASWKELRFEILNLTQILLTFLFLKLFMSPRSVLSYLTEVVNCSWISYRRCWMSTKLFQVRLVRRRLWMVWMRVPLRRACKDWEKAVVVDLM